MRRAVIVRREIDMDDANERMRARESGIMGYRYEMKMGG